MKILRSVTRRGFNVGTAGFFSGVLKGNNWFPASRLPGIPYHIGDQYIGTAEADRQIPKTSLQIIAPSALDRHWVRRALVVLGAIALAGVLVWWLVES